MIQEFEGKVAVVTGAGSGIGRSLAHAFAKRGMKIVIADVNEEALKTVSDDLKANGTEVMPFTIDTSDPEQVANLAEVSYDRFGSANILCNNAGVGAGGPVSLITLADWDWVLGVNLYGVIYGVKFFLDRMLASGEPCHIVNTASLAGLISGELGPYTVSKFAVVALSETLHTECMNTNVGVSVLCPGIVNTGIIENAESFQDERSDLYRPSPEMMEAAKPLRENLKKMFHTTGMDPDIVAKMVIKAIEKDLLHVVTHPEYLPNIEARVEGIKAATLELKQEFSDMIIAPMGTEENDTVYEHPSPAFSVTYPGNWTSFDQPLIPGAVFSAMREGGLSMVVRVFDKADPTIPSDMSIENASQKIILSLSTKNKDINIISNQQMTLKDGTPAHESLIELRPDGFIKRKIHGVTAAKDNMWIHVSTNTFVGNYSDDLKRIVHSLELT